MRSTAQVCLVVVGVVTMLMSDVVVDDVHVDAGCTVYMWMQVVLCTCGCRLYCVHVDAGCTVCMWMQFVLCTYGCRLYCVHVDAVCTVCM